MVCDADAAGNNNEAKRIGNGFNPWNYRSILRSRKAGMGRTKILESRVPRTSAGLEVLITRDSAHGGHFGMSAKKTGHTHSHRHETLHSNNSAQRQTCNGFFFAAGTCWLLLCSFFPCLRCVIAGLVDEWHGFCWAELGWPTGFFSRVENLSKNWSKLHNLLLNSQ
jgi:hypothetical protein